MLSNISANAKVASARKIPPSRNAGMASNAPTAAASTAPISIVKSTGRLQACTSCAVANPPTAAKVAWHNEI